MRQTRPPRGGDSTGESAARSERRVKDTLRTGSSSVDGRAHLCAPRQRQKDVRDVQPRALTPGPSQRLRTVSKTGHIVKACRGFESLPSAREAKNGLKSEGEERPVRRTG